MGRPLAHTLLFAGVLLIAAGTALALGAPVPAVLITAGALTVAFALIGVDVDPKT